MCELKKLKPIVIGRKDGFTFVIHHEAGKEHQLLDALIELARDPKVDYFNWFDAAVLAYEFAQRIVHMNDDKVPEKLVDS
jgi:hypothetical protein